MRTNDHEDTLRELIATHCLLSTKLTFVDSVQEWCHEEGLDERDKNKPMRLLVEGDRACRLVINEIIPDKVVKERINALSVRSALTNVANNRADMLDSDKKKLAYLMLAEYTSTTGEYEDELMADQWVFEEMEKQGFFRE